MQGKLFYNCVKVLFLYFSPCILPVLQQDRMMVFAAVCLTTDNNLRQQDRCTVKDYSLHVQDKEQLLIFQVSGFLCTTLP